MSTSEATSSSDARRPIPRRSHKKSKVGCRTCRMRKVKCDERRPLCANCERHYTNLLACDFDNQNPVFDHGVSSEHRRARDAALPNSSQPRRPRAAQVQRSRVGRQAEELAIPRTVAQGLIDPFEARPLSQEPAPNVDVLMGHYLAYLAYRCFPFYACRALIELWWPFVRSDDLLFNVVLLLSSLDLSRQRDQHDALQTQKLLNQCLTLLSRRIQDAVASVGDHTVVAVATLAVIEHDRGNVRALQTHVEGLKRIVELRGGLDAIRQSNPMAANLVFWCALVGMDEPHILPLTYGSQEDGTSTGLSGLESTTLRTHDGGIADLLAFGVDTVTANILHEVQRLSKLYISVLDSPSPDQGITVLSSLCLIVQHLLQSSQADSHDSPTPGLSRSCRLAGCLHIFAPLSGYFPDPTLLLHTLTTDLKTSLTFFLHAVGTNSHLLLWLLAVGGITAHAMPAERVWYISHLVVVTADLGIASWAQMRRHLVALAFHDNFCDVSFHALWQEVWRRREALVVSGPDERALVSGNEGGL